MNLQTAQTAESPTLPPPPPIDPDRDALFLDFDGTLVAIAERPDAIEPDPDLPALLTRVSRRLSGRLAVVSGRGLDVLDRHLAAAASRAAGLHGWQMRGAPDPGGREGVTEALSRARARLRDEAGALLVEDKGAALALHFRHAPGLGERARALGNEIVASSGGVLALQPGSMVFEIKPAAADKGGAMRAFLAMPEFSGGRPVFAGDDLTDEMGFAAARDGGGFGVLVGPPRPTAASYRLADVAAVLDWLRAAAGDASP